MSKKLSKKQQGHAYEWESKALGKYQLYTIDPVQNTDKQPTDLILVQYGHRDYYAPEFRDGCLNGFAQLEFVSQAYYYDDALWIHVKERAYTPEQVEAIANVVKHVESTLITR